MADSGTRDFILDLILRIKQDPGNASALAQAKQLLEQYKAAPSSATRSEQKAFGDLEAAVKSATTSGENLKNSQQAGAGAAREWARAEEEAAAAAKRQGQNASDAGRQTREHANWLTQFGRGILSQTLGLSLLAGGAVLAGRAVAQFIQSSIQGYADLEREVANISTIKPEIDTSALRNQLSDLQTRVPATAKALAEAYYNIASSINLSAEDTFSLTEKTAKGAAAALAEQQSWAMGVVGVMNTYGDTLSDVDHIQDVFFQTVKNGVISGQQLAIGFGPIAQAAHSYGQSLEEAAAATAAVTKEGGNTQANLTKLKDVFEGLNTNKAQTALHALGIATVDLRGNFLPLSEVLGQLQERLAALSDEQRGQVLAGIFEDKRAREGLQILLNQLPQLTQYLQEAETQAGDTEQAIAKMGDTAAVKAALVRGEVEKFKESVGGFFVGLAQFPFTQAVEGREKEIQKFQQIIQEGIKNNNLQQTIAGQKYYSEMYGQQAVFAEATKREQANIQRYYEATGKAAIGMRSALHEGFSSMATDSGRWANSVERDTQTAADSFVDFSKQVYGTANLVGANLRGTSKEFQDLIASAQQTVGRTTGQDNSKAIGEAANQIETLQNDILRYNELEGQATGEAKQHWHDMAESAKKDIASLLDEINTLLNEQGKIGNVQQADAYAKQLLVNAQFETAQATQANQQSAVSATVRAGDPSYIQSVIAAKQAEAKATEALEQAEKQAGLITETTAERKKRLAQQTATLLPLEQQLARAQDNLDAVQKQNAATLDNLRAKQDGIRLSLQQAEAALNASKRHWQEVTDAIDANIRSLEKQRDAELGTTNPGRPTGLAGSLAADRQALENAQHIADTNLHALDVRLHNLDQSAKETEKSLKAMLAPLESDARVAQQNLDDIARRTQYMNQQFEEAQHTIDMTLRDIEDRYAGPISQAQAAVDAYSDALARLAHEEELALRPFEDALYELNGQLQAHQQNLQEITRSYDQQIIPLQERLNRLREEDRQAQAVADLRSRQTGIENLQNQLLSATGSRRQALLAQIGQEQGALGRAQEENDIQSRLAALQQQKDAAVRAEQEQIQAINQEIQAQRALEEQVRRKYELEQRQARDNEYAARERLTQLQREEAQERQMVQERQRQLDRDRTDFEWQQRNLTILAQQELDMANERLANAQAGGEAVRGLYEGWRQQIQDTRDKQAWDYGEFTNEINNRIFQEQQAYNTIDLFYKGLIGDQQLLRTTAEETAAAEAKELQKPIDKLKDQETQIGLDITATQNLAKETETSAQKQVEKVQTVIDQWKELWKWIDAVNQLQGAGAAIPPGATPPTTPPPPPGADENHYRNPPKPPGAPIGSSTIGGGGDFYTPPPTTTVPVAVPSTVSVADTTTTAGQMFSFAGGITVNSPLPTTPAQVRRFAEQIQRAAYANARPWRGARK